MKSKLLWDTRRPWISFDRVFMAGLTLGLAVAVTALAIHDAAFQWQHRIPFPVMDMFGTISYLDRHSNPSLFDLYKSVRENEHRPIVTYAFYLWERNWTGDSGGILYPAIMAANTILATTFLGPILLRPGLGIATKALLASIAFYSFFSIFHFENLTWQKQLHEISCLAILSFGFLSAAAVSGRADRPQPLWSDVGYAGAAGFGCLLATYSFGFGLLGWPVILLHGALRKWRLASLLTFGAFAAFALATYAVTYSGTKHTDPFDALRRPLELSAYISRLVGAPFSYFLTGLPPGTVPSYAPHVLSALGLLAAAGLVIHTYWSLSEGRNDTARRVVASHAAMTIIAALGMATMVGLGRVTINAGLDSRYVVVSSLFWIGTLGLAATLLRPRSASTVILLAGLVTMVIGTLPDRHYKTVLRAREQDLYRAAIAATYRLHYWGQFPALTTIPRITFEVWHKPRPPFLAFVQREPFNWIGTDISKLPRVPESSRCLGYLEAVTPLAADPSLLSLGGWAFIAAPDSRLQWLVVTDEENRGIGAGKPGLVRLDVRAHYASAGVEENKTDQVLSGYLLAAVLSPGKKVVLWGIDTAGRACRF